MSAVATIWSHLHPVMEERFELLEGRPSFLARGTGALREALSLAARHREMVVLLLVPPMPPPLVQRLLFSRHNRR